MSFKHRLSLIILVSLVVIYKASDTSAKPATPFHKLPRITVDTLYNTTPEPVDNNGSESLMLLRYLNSGAQMLQNRIRPQRQEATYVTLFRLPWRIARSVSQTSYGMARSFVDTFAHQFMETYQTMQKNVIPKAATAASQAYAVWTNPPKQNMDTQWLDGGV